MPFVTKVFKFCAAHSYDNPQWSEEKNKKVFGNDVRLHGHNYTLEVTVTGEIDPNTGFVADLAELRKIVNERVVDVLDHSTIGNDIAGFGRKQPSTENMVIWIWERIEPQLKSAKLHRIRLRETPTIYTDYFGPEG